MIKFFSRIRRRLLRENRFTRYVVYAIGEIILVVIGILIALQINNWNENQKLQKTQKKLLASMYQELSKDHDILGFYIAQLQTQTPIRRIVYESRNPSLILDSIWKINNPINLDIQLKSTVYDKAANLGITEFSDNEPLNKAIEDYYVISTDRFNRFTRFYHDFVLTEFEYYKEKMPHNLLEYYSSELKGQSQEFRKTLDTVKLKEHFITFNNENETLNKVLLSIYSQEEAIARFVTYKDSIMSPLLDKMQYQLRRYD